MMIKKTKLAVNMTTMSKMRTKKGVAEIAVLDVLHIIGSKKTDESSAEASRSRVNSAGNILALLNPAHAGSVHSHSSAAQRGTGMFNI